MPAKFLPLYCNPLDKICAGSHDTALLAPLIVRVSHDTILLVSCTHVHCCLLTSKVPKMTGREKTVCMSATGYISRQLSILSQRDHHCSHPGHLAVKQIVPPTPCIPYQVLLSVRLCGNLFDSVRVAHHDSRHHEVETAQYHKTGSHQTNRSHIAMKLNVWESWPVQTLHSPLQLSLVLVGQYGQVCAYKNSNKTTAGQVFTMYRHVITACSIPSYVIMYSCFNTYPEVCEGLPHCDC